ncbi:MAG TPA: hypothetical protein VIY51_12845 [Xanthobacteraceae bacterium]
MLHARVRATVALAAMLTMPIGAARAADAARYPDWQGAWARFVVGGLGGQPSFDQTKSWGLGQQAPLTAEYQKVLEDSIADQAQGGQGNFAEHAQCFPAGMPLMMIAFRPLEFVITPATTYVLVGGSDHYRRIFTDGRDWPKDIVPTYSGYAIGRWIDERGSGRYDVLEVETRGPFKGRRAYDATGLPLHFDNQSVFKERIHLDKADQNLMHDETTVLDHALTRPWTVDKKYVRSPTPHPDWDEAYCAEGTALVTIGSDMYYLSGDGMLMPARKGQRPPDLRYFK